MQCDTYFNAHFDSSQAFFHVKLTLGYIGLQANIIIRMNFIIDISLLIIFI